MASQVRVTELANALTADLDVASTIGAVRLLGASDAGLFSGWGGHPGISSDEMVAAAASLVRSVCSALRHASGRVVFAGCGTSGRLAHLISRGLNAWLNRASLPVSGRFDYLIAGADAALLLPQEAVEDQHDSGRRDLEDWVSTARLEPGVPVVIVGISCGLSATYVASMLQAALARPGFTAVAVGFNSVEAVRDVRVDGWEGSFHAVLTEMLAAERARAIVLNPIVGPESVAGSSRMKGGSATKILLETACSLGVYAALGCFDAADDAGLADRLRAGYAQYEATVRCVYNEAESIGRLVDDAAASLLAARDFEAAAAVSPPAGFVAPTGHGRLLYVGVGTPGLLGIVDASECYPTYGSRFNDVHGFVADGWEAMANKQGPVDGLAVPAHLRADRCRPTASTPQRVSLDLASFDRDYLPTLCADDTVVLLAAQEAAGGCAGEAQIAAALRSLAAARTAGARVSYILALLRSDADAEAAQGAGLAIRADALLAAAAAVAPRGVAIRLPELRLRWETSTDVARAAAAAAPSVLAELAMKLVLNATTTVAHVQRGAIFGNRMINVGITNAKLFHRAAGIVRSVTACSEAVAIDALLRSIYHVDADSDVSAFPAGAPSLAALRALPVSSHVAAAAVQLDLVPVAILLAAAALGGPSRSLTEGAAAACLRSDPVVRRALAAALKAP